LGGVPPHSDGFASLDAAPGFVNLTQIGYLIVEM
jgi:hypothetical protein